MKKKEKCPMWEIMTDTMLNHYHSGLMEDKDANTGSNDEEA